MFATIGNIEMMMHTTTRPTVPNPQIEPISGVRAITGIACSATRYGHTDRSSHCACAMANASNMPMTMAMPSPISEM